MAYAVFLTVPALATRSEEPPQIPPELQAAIDNGQEEEVKKLLDKAPDTWSKSLKKKLLKDVQIIAKKIAKGGAPPPPKPAAAGSAPPGASKGAAAPASAAPKIAAPTGAGTAEGVVGSAEAVLVADLVACASSLGLSEDSIAKLRASEAALALSIAPRVNALRNEAYSRGFMAAS